MSETLKAPTRKEIEDSVARGEESKWNVGPDGEMLSEGYTMNDLGEVVWVGQGTAPDDKTAKIEETEVVKKEVAPTDELSNSEQLFNALKAKKLYDGDYNNFTEQFSTPDTQNQLFKALKAKKQYDGNAGEFLDTFFPIANEVDSTEVKEAPSQGDVTVKGDDGASSGEDDSTVTPDDVTINPEAQKVRDYMAGPDWFSTNKSKLDQVLENTEFETPLTQKDILDITTDLQLAGSPRIQELEARELHLDGSGEVILC